MYIKQNTIDRQIEIYINIKINWYKQSRKFKYFWKIIDIKRYKKKIVIQDT